ncbi:uncharacterized protein YjiS (DUF1127 family) [Amaricoccus macauensis]|uniref:Uncharacterized protein YjiS (DUF1127 family) n=1 Tax=Amaricoccus macauensis TaxID=57001 RepID=A0A840SQ23_9RHOB|nr:DUF1127 domain-containing protein [Amaricoccus macauensis]MBB5221372.1 uncharacterized protein YjiS (DUF1127 family) [Amaricoccus macauensis]
MAHALTNSAAAASGLGLIDRVRAAFARYRAYRNTLIELQSLSSRELADLGLSRASVRDVAREAAYSRF